MDWFRVKEFWKVDSQVILNKTKIGLVFELSHKQHKDVRLMVFAVRNKGDFKDNNISLKHLKECMGNGISPFSSDFYIDWDNDFNLVQLGNSSCKPVMLMLCDDDITDDPDYEEDYFPESGIYQNDDNLNFYLDELPILDSVDNCFEYQTSNYSDYLNSQFMRVSGFGINKLCFQEKNPTELQYPIKIIKNIHGSIQYLESEWDKKSDQVKHWKKFCRDFATDFNHSVNMKFINMGDKVKFTANYG